MGLRESNIALIRKSWKIRCQFNSFYILCLGTNKQAADHYLSMVGNRVKVSSSADVTAGARTVARCPGVGRCGRRRGGAEKKKQNEKEQGGKRKKQMKG